MILPPLAKKVFVLNSHWPIKVDHSLKRGWIKLIRVAYKMTWYTDDGIVKDMVVQWWSWGVQWWSCCWWLQNEKEEEDMVLRCWRKEERKKILRVGEFIFLSFSFYTLNFTICTPLLASFFFMAIMLRG